GCKAKGKRVTTYQVDRLEFIEPLHKSVPADPSEGMGDQEPLPPAPDEQDDEPVAEQSLFD
ncbi:MAG: hypothetical protein K2F53_04845, partial [Rikenellaceae bacterium]|nr:hypothetical protein [Rikenellaceae bacterium]